MLIEIWCKELDKYELSYVDLADCLERPYSVSIEQLAVAYHFVNSRPSIQMMADLIVPHLKQKDSRAMFSIFYRQARERIPKNLLKSLPRNFKELQALQDRRVSKMIDSLMSLSNPKENHKVHESEQNTSEPD